jgi:hypothetical protein
MTLFLKFWDNSVKSIPVILVRYGKRTITYKKSDVDAKFVFTVPMDEVMYFWVEP